MGNKDQQSQCKKIELYNSEILALQFKIEEISQILTDLDKNHILVNERKKVLVKVIPKVNVNIANILNISYEECVKLPTETILARLTEEQKKSKHIATEKLKFIATLSKSLLHLTTIIKSKK